MNIKLKTYLIGFLILISFSSCIDEDLEVILNDTPGASLTPSNNLIIALNRRTLEQNCFQIHYPITLGYNINSSVQIENEEGLLNVIQNQSSNFYINSIVFPINVTHRNQVLSINNENDLVTLLIDCGDPTIRSIFESTFFGCLDFVFPIVAFDINGTEVTLNSRDEFSAFYDAQGLSYQPNIQLPVTIVNPNEETIVMNSYYDFLQIAQSCRNCQDASFTLDLFDPYISAYIVRPINIPEEVKILYYRFDGIGTMSTNQFSEEQNQWVPTTFISPPGRNSTYCQSLPSSYCENSEVCMPLFADFICANLGINLSRDPGTTDYIFSADIPSFNIEFNWSINDTIIAESNPNNIVPFIQRSFDIGERVKVCISYANETCPEGREKCITFNAYDGTSQSCPALNFEARQTGTSPGSYIFVADFPGIENENFSWYVDDVFVGYGGSNNNNELPFTLNEGVTTTVCIRSNESQYCPNGTSFCQTFTP